LRTRSISAGRLLLRHARVRSCRSAQPERDREWPGLSPERAPGSSIRDMRAGSWPVRWSRVR